jgi:ectoine hydroxylase-related dioxygenase (phytanoyl-CoA dioxygenase family)
LESSELVDEQKSKMNEELEFAGSEETGKLGVKHLKRFWARTLGTRDGKIFDDYENDRRFDNLVLNGLRLPLEETLCYLSRFAPDFEEFENWILTKNGGAIDELQIERLNCVLSNQPYGERLLNSLQQVEESVDVLTAEDLDFWEENGFVIVREAVSESQARAAETAVWEFLEMEPNDSASWYEKPIGKGIMMDFYHHPALLENRRAPRILKAFAQLWKTADLWATTDRTSFNPPETENYSFQGPRLHWDMSLEPPFRFGTQGLLYLCDTPAEQGAFCCVPKFHRKLEKWLEDLPEHADPRQVNLESEAVPIAGHAGDFVIWHHALPHGSSPNRGKHPRIVQYLNMYPSEFRENEKWK